MSHTDEPHNSWVALDVLGVVMFLGNFGFRAFAVSGLIQVSSRELATGEYS